MCLFYRGVRRHPNGRRRKKRNRNHWGGGNKEVVGRGQSYQISYFKAKMYQVRPRPRWESSQRSPLPTFIAGFKGSYFWGKGRERKGKGEEEGEEGEVEGRGRGREGEGAKEGRERLRDSFFFWGGRGGRPCFSITTFALKAKVIYSNEV